jgi:uncharacterized membrane protein
MRFLTKLGELLLAGLLALLPVYLTIQVLVWVFGFVDKEVGGVLEPLVGRHIPGSGIMITFLLVFTVGLFTRWWVTDRIIGWFEAVTLRIPGLGHLYKAIKRLLDPLSRKEDKPFREAVWVPLNGDLEALGFVTSGALDTGDGDPASSDEDERVSVYLPSNQPYLGHVTVVRRGDLTPAPFPLDEAISFEFSFGAATPPNIRTGKPDEEVR